MPVTSRSPASFHLFTWPRVSIFVYAHSRTVFVEFGRDLIDTEPTYMRLVPTFSSARARGTPADQHHGVQHSTPKLLYSWHITYERQLCMFGTVSCGVWCASCVKHLVSQTNQLGTMTMAVDQRQTDSIRECTGHGSRLLVCSQLQPIGLHPAAHQASDCILTSTRKHENRS